MTMRPTRWPLALAAILLLLVVAACGPAGNTNNTGDKPEGDTGEAAPAPVADSINNEPSFEVVADSEETTRSGLPAGFTSDGYPYLGDPTAPIVMEEFSDFQCPFCARFFDQTMPSLKENQIANGEVVLVFYDFPLTNIHPQAVAAHLAARCAADEGAAAFWAMHDSLFAGIGEWSGQGSPEPIFVGFAEEIGLDTDAFSTCLTGRDYEAAVSDGFNIGRARGVNSTPSFFLNDALIAGAQPLDVFEGAIETLLSGGELAAAATNDPQQQEPAVAPTPASLTDDFAAAMGDPNAPVPIVEFTDYQCPYCARHSAETMPLLMNQMIETGRVYYILKDLPLENIHPEARRASAAARCAGEQEAYWGMHDALFANQQAWSGQPDGGDAAFTALAEDLELDMRDFSECLASGRHDPAVMANLREGTSLGAAGTPYFFVNGFPVRGAQPYELFEFAIGLAEEGTLADAYTQQPQEQQAADTEPAGPVDVPLDNAVFSIGDPDAPVVIVEYTDFQCPFCSRHFQETYPQILANYVETGQVRYVFKDFPLISIHPQAVLAAEAARCAADQGDYLGMHDMLFSRQGEWSGRGDAAEVFVQFADELGLDTDSFAACLSSHQNEAAVMADLAEGQEIGVRGTPAFFINGYFVNGAQPYSVFEQAITQLSAN